ncbi:MAG: hypothetical protein HYT69_01710 [Candidatus Zambryskibacteria bacterium]|nr:hypothetical protein [Candidatus Zambryskibacteria bacterium]
MTLSELIWQRGSAREIMREARERFRDSIGLPAGKHVALASVHYSLTKRYLDRWWQIPLAWWHSWRAVIHARKAYAMGVTDYNQADVVSRILSKGITRDRRRAMEILQQVLSYIPASESAELLPHARALMLCTLGELEWRRGNTHLARRNYYDALQLVPAIEQELSDDRERQLVRVLKAIVFFYLDHGDSNDIYMLGVELLKRTLELTRRVSKDQEEKVLAGCRRRGISIE